MMNSEFGIRNSELPLTRATVGVMRGWEFKIQNSKFKIGFV